MAGIVVSDRRLVLHRTEGYLELPAGAAVRLQVRPQGHGQVVTIAAADGKAGSVTLDRGGMMLLRRVLAEGHFRAVWD
jgi:hypothetical protein